MIQVNLTNAEARMLVFLVRENHEELSRFYKGWFSHGEPYMPDLISDFAKRVTEQSESLLNKLVKAVTDG